VGVRPEETRFVQEVHVDARPSALRLSCDRCGSVELVLLDHTEFDDYVKRFMRTHPNACLNVTAPSEVDT
jgi:hypothetical protein